MVSTKVQKKFIAKSIYLLTYLLTYIDLTSLLSLRGDVITRGHQYTGWLKKSKLLILAVNEINASPTRVSFAKFIPTLVEKMFDMCSIVPNYSLKSLSPFVYTLVDERL